jgi:aminoglycoside phosphotransferase (APT) family kinase protein
LLPLTHDFGATGSDERGRAGWAEVARDPGPFLGLGLCAAEWLNRALPRLRAAQNAAVVEGDDLVHNDVRSDNLCLTPDRGMLLIDWNLPRRGNGAFDLAFAAPSVHMEGGPLPEAWVDDDGRMAAIVSGYFAGRAGLPQIPDAPRVRWIQLEQLRVALPWAARALGLGPLDGDAP